MSVEYDKYYQTENLFGQPYPELIHFYSAIKEKGTLLDLGCGQGRDAIALAKLGFDVTGVDYSKVGIEQLNAIAKRESLSLIGLVDDIYNDLNLDQFDFILLNSMFHFNKKDKEKEVNLLNRIIENSKIKALITICIQKKRQKLEVLHNVISNIENLIIVHQIDLIYKYEDQASNHSSETEYQMITIKKN